MTLDTRVYLTGPIDGETAFTLALQAICDAAGRSNAPSTTWIERIAKGDIPKWAQDRMGAKLGDGTELDEAWLARQAHTRDAIYSTLGQGLPAITDVTFNADGTPLATEDVWSDDDPEDRYIIQRACRVELSWDTAYSYRDSINHGCSALHAHALTLLASRLPDGVTVRWRNEYSGDIYDGVTPESLRDFCGNGVEADAWFQTVALPAIAAGASRTSIVREARREVRL